MKAPKYIKEAIKRCANNNQKVTYDDRLIRDWMEEHKLDDEYNNSSKYMVDTYIDLVTMTNQPENFIDRLENLEE